MADVSSNTAELSILKAGKAFYEAQRKLHTDDGWNETNREKYNSTLTAFQQAIEKNRENIDSTDISGFKVREANGGELHQGQTIFYLDGYPSLDSLNEGIQTLQHSHGRDSEGHRSTARRPGGEDDGTGRTTRTASKPAPPKESVASQNQRWSAEPAVDNLDLAPKSYFSDKYIADKAKDYHITDADPAKRRELVLDKWIDTVASKEGTDKDKITWEQLEQQVAKDFSLDSDATFAESAKARELNREDKRPVKANTGETSLSEFNRKWNHAKATDYPELAPKEYFTNDRLQKYAHGKDLSDPKVHRKAVKEMMAAIQSSVSDIDGDSSWDDYRTALADEFGLESDASFKDIAKAKTNSDATIKNKKALEQWTSSLASSSDSYELLTALKSFLAISSTNEADRKSRALVNSILAKHPLNTWDISSISKSTISPSSGSDYTQYTVPLANGHHLTIKSRSGILLSITEGS